MTPIAPVTRPGRVVALTNTVNGWWPGLSRRCQSCGGRLSVDLPTLGCPGRIVCLCCARELSTADGVVEVVDRPYRTLSREEIRSFAHARIGRPPGRRAP